MIPILMYHQVAEIPAQLDPLSLAVPPAQFEQQMAFLSNHGYRCFSLPVAVRYLRQGGRVPPKTFVLTFDDGYQNVYSNACPILDRFAFTATIFLVAGRMGLASDWDGQDGILAAPLLSWSEARELVGRGYEMGSHTFTHPRLNNMDDKSAFMEISDSKLLLEDRLDQHVDFFSYPYSSSSTRIERLVEAAGYVAACGGPVSPWSLFRLCRIQCSVGDSRLSFALKACGWYSRFVIARESTPANGLRRCVRALRNQTRTHNFARTETRDDGHAEQPGRCL